MFVKNLITWTKETPQKGKEIEVFLNCVFLKNNVELSAVVSRQLAIYISFFLQSMALQTLQMQTLL